jgi:hypothetical protein
MSSLAAKIKKLDVYKKIPKDLSEGTNIGGFISILTVVTLLVLVFFESRAFLFPEYKSELRADDPITRDEMT